MRRRLAGWFRRFPVESNIAGEIIAIPNGVRPRFPSPFGPSPGFESPTHPGPAVRRDRSSDYVLTSCCDLDPRGTGSLRVVRHQGLEHVNERLRIAGGVSWLKTSGGLESTSIYPLNPLPYEQWAHCGELLARTVTYLPTAPNRSTTNVIVAKRPAAGRLDRPVSATMPTFDRLPA